MDLLGKIEKVYLLPQSSNKIKVYFNKGAILEINVHECIEIFFHRIKIYHTVTCAAPENLIMSLIEYNVNVSTEKLRVISSDMLF